MSGLLADVFSFGNTAKRKIKGLLDDPVGTLTQYVNNENDRAGRFNQLTAEAAQEGAQAIKSGKSMVGPKSQQLAGLLADAYNPAGMVVWHGSPHRFTKFDSSKIGTGEGAQAYGHGLYVAESPETAKMYQSTLSKFDLPDGDNAMGIAKIIAAKGDKGEELVRRGYGGLKPGSQELEAKIAQAKEAIDKNSSLYKIDLPDEHIAKMLDWDKPLSQQAPEVQKALQAKQVQESIAKLKASGQLGDYSPAELQQLKGEDWYDMLRQSAGDSNAAPSDFLRQQGIPGIRYLDGGSRGTGQGTSNFVVFPGNEDLLKILEINGKPVNGLLSN